jgi:hypothetical protein
LEKIGGGRGSITWNLERQVQKRLWNWNVSFYGSSAMETWREGPIIGDFEVT